MEFAFSRIREGFPKGVEGFKRVLTKRWIGRKNVNEWYVAGERTTTKFWVQRDGAGEENVGKSDTKRMQLAASNSAAFARASDNFTRYLSDQTFRPQKRVAARQKKRTEPQQPIRPP